MWYVYIAQSQKDKQLYTGISQDPEKRIKKHNNGSTKSTRSRRPFVLIYTEKCLNRSEARKREKFLKSGFGREFIKSLKLRGVV